MQQLVLVIHVIIAVALIALILLQQGKGAEVGASFGSGASQTMFGSQGATSFLVKVTGVLAALFFMTSLSLGYMAAHSTKQAQETSLLNLSKTPQVPVPDNTSLSAPLPAEVATQSTVANSVVKSAGKDTTVESTPLQSESSTKK